MHLNIDSRSIKMRRSILKIDILNYKIKIKILIFLMAIYIYKDSKKIKIIQRF